MINEPNLKLSPKPEAIANQAQKKLMDIPSLKNAINDKEVAITRKRTEYYRLVEQFKVQVKEKQDVVEKLTIEDAQKMRQQLQLRNKILELEKTQEKALNEQEKTMGAAITDMKDKGAESLAEGEVKVGELKEQILSMKELERKKQVYEAEIYQWELSCQKLNDKITQTKYQNQIELARKKREIEADFDEQIENFKQQASQEAQRNIQQIEKQIHLENQKLAEKTISQRYTIDYYKREISALQTLNKNLKRDVTLNQGTQDQYQARGENQGKKIQIYKGKIQILEKSLQQIVADFEKEKELVRYQHDQVIKEQREEIANAKENLRVKNRELRNVRALSQVIIDQRSEVEQFFLEALDQIKEEIRKKVNHERKAKQASAVSGHGGQSINADMSKMGNESTGLAGNVDMTSGSNMPLPDKVDLNDLDWEDRERVLRLLFSKINSGINQKTAAQKHNLKAQQAREQELRAVISEEDQQEQEGINDYQDQNYHVAIGQHEVEADGDGDGQGGVYLEGDGFDEDEDEFENESEQPVLAIEN